jgi:hypothetical protein
MQFVSESAITGYATLIGEMLQACSVEQPTTDSERHGMHTPTQRCPGSVCRDCAITVANPIH